MKQSSQHSGASIFKQIVFFVVLVAMLATVSLGYAKDNLNNFLFNGKNATGDKADLMFYSDDNAGNDKGLVLFKAALGRKLSDGVEVTASESQYAIKLTPITMNQGIGTRSGNRITYEVSPGVHIIYAFKENGVKEEIIFDNPSDDVLSLGFRMEIDEMLEARIDRKGNILIYGPNAVLSNFIQAGDEKSAELILKARRNAQKDNLLYIIPAPVVIDGAGREHKDLAHYTLEESILTLHVDELSYFPAPVMVDPSIVITTTADFMKGNNEGMISYDVDAISRGVASGGRIGNWNVTNAHEPRTEQSVIAYNDFLYVIGGYYNGTYYSTVRYAPAYADGTVGSWSDTTSLPSGRSDHISVVYNGYLYVVGGYNATSGALDEVLFAPINTDGTVGTWTATTSFPTARYGHSSVAHNGYLYIVGGFNGSHLDSIYYAPIKADGTVGTWTATTSLITPRSNHASVAYNGYLYVVGGFDGTSYLNLVHYAPIKANGTIGTWTSSPTLPTPRNGHSLAVYNGHLYVIGGFDGSAALNDVQYAPINGNGKVGVWSSTASLTTARYGHSSVAYNGYLYVVCGYSDTNGTLGDVMFAPIEAQDGSVKSWTATTAFPTPRSSHTSVVYNGYLYVIGGFTGVQLNSVYYAPISADGTVGSWNATTSFTTARAGHTSVIYNGYLYIIGGGTGTVSLNDVQYTLINDDGTLGTWNTTTSFTTARSGHTSIAYNGYLYVIGGLDAPNYYNDVQFAPINTDGTLGSWTSTTSFLTGRCRHTSVAYRGYLYVIGGATSVTTFLNDVQFAHINANGTLGTWTSTTSFNTARSSHETVAYNGYLYVIGGYNLSSHNDIQFALINANGTLGAWTDTTSFPTARYGHTSVVYNGYLYIICGYTGTSYLSDVQFVLMNTNGTLTDWNISIPVPTESYAHTSVAYKGYLYVIGGYNGSALSTVYYAPITDQGWAGPWTATTSLPTARSAHSSVVYNGYLYVIGGYGGSYLNSVQFAHINSNGTIGSWATTTSFSIPRRGHTSVAYNGYLYVLGGEDGLLSYRNDVQFAPINANGTLGSWTTTASFATARRSHTSVVYNGYLYVLGGFGAAYFNDVQYAPIYSNGTIGSWIKITSFTGARTGHTSVVYNGYLYVIGGYFNLSYLGDVQSAPINSNGTVGTWTGVAVIPTGRYYHSSATYNGYLWVIGGYDGYSTLDEVWYTTLSGPAARARYSRLVDIGLDQIVDSISFSSSATKGVTNLTYALATSATAVFGPRATIPNATAGTLYTINNCARYMWVYFDLDDTLSVTREGGGANGRKDVLDFGINYSDIIGVGNSLMVSKWEPPYVRLTWNSSPNADKYDFMRCDAKNPPCIPVVIDTPTSNTWDDPVLGDGVDYWYLIEAIVGDCLVP